MPQISAKGSNKEVYKTVTPFYFCEKLADRDQDLMVGNVYEPLKLPDLKYSDTENKIQRSKS